MDLNQVRRKAFTQGFIDGFTAPFLGTPIVGGIGTLNLQGSHGQTPETLGGMTHKHLLKSSL